LLTVGLALRGHELTVGGRRAENPVRMVEEELDREYQKWSAAGVDSMPVVVVHVEEHELVWLITWQSEVFRAHPEPGGHADRQRAVPG